MERNIEQDAMDIKLLKEENKQLADVIGGGGNDWRMKYNSLNDDFQLLKNRYL